MLASDCINYALREQNMIPLGGTAPTSWQTEALIMLNSLTRTLFSHELKSRLRDWTIPFPSAVNNILADFPELPYDTNALPAVSNDLLLNPPCNVRLLCASTSAVAKTVYFPWDPFDGARIAFVDLGIDAAFTLNGNGRLIDGSADAVFYPVSALNATTTWFYRADLGQWKTVADMGLSDATPLPDEYDDYFVTALSIRLSARFRQDIGAATMMRYNDMLSKIKQRYRIETALVGQGSQLAGGEDGFYRSGSWWSTWNSWYR